jgi:hypothetical protein
VDGVNSPRASPAIGNGTVVQCQLRLVAATGYAASANERIEFLRVYCGDFVV